jgi:hypothetical protein
MSMPSLNSARPLADAVSKIGTYVAVAALLGFLVLGVVISPVAFSAVGAADRDWGRLSTIGQAYGSVSALLSAAALCLVVLLQRHQVRHERLTLVRDMHLSVVGTALDDPEYCQCWGARVAGDDMDERLFYYTSSILTLWWYAYEIGDLRDEQVRSYGRGMFESEVPREYWRMHGRWRLSGVRTRRHRRFLLIIDEAFQEAEASGPPVRRRERARSPRPRAARRAPARPGKGLRRRLR